MRHSQVSMKLLGLLQVILRHNVVLWVRVIEATQVHATPTLY